MTVRALEAETHPNGAGPSTALARRVLRMSPVPARRLVPGRILTPATKGGPGKPIVRRPGRMIPTAIVAAHARLITVRAGITAPGVDRTAGLANPTVTVEEAEGAGRSGKGRITGIRPFLFRTIWEIDPDGRYQIFAS
jgi:hypothetical protein